MKKAKARIGIIGLVIACFALLSGSFISHYLLSEKKIDPSQFNGTVFTAREISQFRLKGIDRQVFTNQSLKGQWTFLFFGFTSCGSLCPTTLSELAKMYRILEKTQVKPLPKIVMISLDPKRDSLEKLSTYVKAFDPHFYGARGSKNVIKKMATEMGIAYAKISSLENSTNYDIQHSGAVMLVNPQAKLQAFFTMPHHAMRLVKDYQQFCQIH